jgi:ribonuclease HI
MNIPAPHFLLFSEARRKHRQGLWRFVLQAADGSAVLEASDVEPHVVGERLELLAVIRGLEALDQPSRVTLLTPSKYVNRGMAYGIDDWRRNGWTWECFGQMVPVKNRDLWQRLDRASGFHVIDFRMKRFDGAHALPEPEFAARCEGSGFRVQDSGAPALPEPEFAAQTDDASVAPAHGRTTGRLTPPARQKAAPAAPLNNGDAIVLTAPNRDARSRTRRWSARLNRSLRERVESWKLGCAQLGTCWLPKPWLD